MQLYISLYHFVCFLKVFFNRGRLIGARRSKIWLLSLALRHRKNKIYVAKRVPIYFQIIKLCDFFAKVRAWFITFKIIHSFAAREVLSHDDVAKIDVVYDAALTR